MASVAPGYPPTASIVEFIWAVKSDVEINNHLSNNEEDVSANIILHIHQINIVVLPRGRNNDFFSRETVFLPERSEGVK